MYTGSGVRHCFILANNEFENDGRICGYGPGQDVNLPGYVKDVERLTNTFQALKFDVHVERNKTAEDMKAIVRHWSSIVDYKHSECAIVILLSHGGK